MGSITDSIQTVSVSTRGCIIGGASGSAEGKQKAQKAKVAGEPSIAWVQFAGPPLNPVTSYHDLTGSLSLGFHQHGGGCSGGSLAAMQADATIESHVREHR